MAMSIETGHRTAREDWQIKQLRNLLQHAAQRSAFWRKRIGSKRIKDINLSDLPVLTRSEVLKQVETEGSLIPQTHVTKHSTSGSSGTPVQFFVSDRNSYYNKVRFIAQYFMEGRDLTLNRTRFKSAQNRIEGGFSVKKTGGWLGPLSELFKGGNNKDISHLHPNRDLLFRELAKDPIGYLIIQPRLVEALFTIVTFPFFLKTARKCSSPFRKKPREVCVKSSPLQRFQSDRLIQAKKSVTLVLNARIAQRFFTWFKAM